MCSSRTTRSGGRDRGFVLATTLLVTTLLTVMLAASFILVSSEQRITDNSFGTTKALAIAQAGLENYFSQNRGLDTSSTYDSTRITASGGYADVVARRLRPAGATVGSPLALWAVRSSGVATTNVMAGQVSGSRTIAEFAQLNVGILPARAAMVAINGVQMQGTGSNPINGSDRCDANQDTVGLTVTASPYGYNPGQGGASSPSGHPVGVEALGTTAALIDSTGIDWPSLVGGNLTPDYTLLAGSSWKPAGTTMTTTGYVPGDLTLLSGATGRGLLVVTGDLHMSNSVVWHGVILVGGRLIEQSSSPNYTLYGMITTGLNVGLGSNVQADLLTRRGTSDIQWSSCNVGKAIAGQSAMVPIKNAWADTWSSY